MSRKVFYRRMLQLWMQDRLTHFQSAALPTELSRPDFAFASLVAAPDCSAPGAAHPTKQRATGESAASARAKKHCLIPDLLANVNHVHVRVEEWKGEGGGSDGEPGAGRTETNVGPVH